MARKKTKQDEARERLEAAGFGVRNIRKVTPSKKVKAAPPSFERRKSEIAARRELARKIPAQFKKDFDKYGARAWDVLSGDGKTRRGRGGYYTAKAAHELIRLGDNPRKPQAVTTVKKNYIISNIPGKPGKYKIKIDGVLQNRILTERQKKNIEERIYWDRKIKLVSDKTGATEAEVRALVKKIRGQEKTRLKRFKTTKKYKKMKSKQKARVTVKNRLRAIFGAMTDLLQIYGSPKAEPEKGKEK